MRPHGRSSPRRLHPSFPLPSQLFEVRHYEADLWRVVGHYRYAGFEVIGDPQTLLVLAQISGYKELELVMSQFIRARKAGAGGEGNVPNDPEFRKRFPAMWEYMTTRKVGKDARETSTMFLMIDGGAFKACFNDRDQHEAMWVTADTFQGALDAIEENLAGGTGDWRADKRSKR